MFRLILGSVQFDLLASPGLSKDLLRHHKAWFLWHSFLTIPSSHIFGLEAIAANGLVSSDVSVVRSLRIRAGDESQEEPLLRADFALVG